MTPDEMRRLVDAVLRDPMPDVATNLAKAVRDLLPVVEAAEELRDRAMYQYSGDLSIVNRHALALLAAAVDTLRGKEQANG